MDHNDTSGMKVWPDWLAQLGPGMAILLEAIDRHREELQRTCTSSHVYKRLGQAQIIEFEQLGQKQAVFGPGKQLKFDVLKGLGLAQATLRAVVYNVGQRHLTLNALLYAKKVFLLKMLAEMPAAFQSGNLFGGFAAIRGVFECIGELHWSVAALADIRSSSDAHWMGTLLDDVINIELASPLDWTRVATAEFRQYEDLGAFHTGPVKERNVSYEPMKGIRALNKKVKGLMPAYEVLVEFAQPRVGTLWLVYEQSRTVPDRFRTFWHRNQLGIGFPRTMTEQMKPVIVQIFDVLYDCLPVLKQIEKDFSDVDARMAKTTRDEVRTMLWHFPHLFEKHEDCPCGSGKRVKYCCGE